MSGGCVPRDAPSAAGTARRVRAGEESAADAVRAALDRIEATEERLRAFLRVDRAGALDRAAGLDRRLDRGQDPGPLAGVPVALKDNLALAGRPLTCGSRILEGYVSPFTATAVERLLAAGAVVVGQTNLDELAMGSSTETSAFGPTTNPWDPERVPGGSSGGSAAAVAAGAVPLALGSDTGGSVRQPAALCGVVGLKPTWGRVSRRGLVAFASSLDQVGPLARTVEDAALAFSAIAGPDPGDATCANVPVEDPVPGLEDGVEGVRIGTVRELGADGGVELPEGVRTAFGAALAALGDAGAEVSGVSVPAIAAALPAYYVLATAEASSNLARFDGVRYGRRAPTEASEGARAVIEASRSAGFGAEVTRRILLGTFVLSAGYADRYYGRARAVRAALRAQLEDAFRGVDLLATPTTPDTAFPLGSRLRDPVAMARSDRFTTPASLAGLPALSVPCGVGDDGLPLGLQLVAPAFGEALLLRAARVVEVSGLFPGSAGRSPGSGGGEGRGR